jgi:hypothetical protein
MPTSRNGTVHTVYICTHRRDFGKDVRFGVSSTFEAISLLRISAQNQQIKTRTSARRAIAVLREGSKGKTQTKL